MSGRADGTSSYQSRVTEWGNACFGPAISGNREERIFRFIEEALELAQACEATRDDVLRLVEYVFARPAGDRAQEVGGVMVTLACLCSAWGEDLAGAAEAELARVWANLERIRAKHESKPVGVRTPLPGTSEVNR